MATVTPNFNWPVPTSTDLVKDGATAIEALGDSIDASLVDLKGGTTGQVLSKTSGTDMDFTWVTSDDANAIQNSIVDAKGDLIAASANDTPARLAVGANGETLVADSSTATGLKWAAPASANGPAFSAYRITSNQSITAATFTKAQLNAEHFDTDSCFDSTTNYRFTPTKAGKYQINFIGQITQTGGAGRAMFVIYKNGSAYVRGYDNTTTYAGPQSGGSVLMDFNGTTDYAEFYVYSATTATFDAMSGGAGAIFSGSWIRS